MNWDDEPQYPRRDPLWPLALLYCLFLLGLILSLS